MGGFQSRVRQLQFGFAVPQVGQITETSDYTHFGIPVHVTIPPASAVETLQQFQKDLCEAVQSSGSTGGFETVNPYGNQTQSPAEQRLSDDSDPARGGSAS